jgi:predicted ArsR family transcriptional regulator
MKSPADDILLQLKTRGPARTQAIADALQVSRQAARVHLEKLQAAGLVTAADERDGVGRPRQAWTLTPAGHGRFPDTHAQMTVELIEAVREEFGAAGLDRLVTRREEATARTYRQALDGHQALEARLERLAQLRRAEGYMAEWRADPDGGYLLIENHCPICAAAQACQGFCRSELALFEMLLAPARVVRGEHLLTGARRCTYKVNL